MVRRMLSKIHLSRGGVWIDLVSPTAEEETDVERTLAVDVPTVDEIRRFEPSSRFYREGDAVYMAARIVVQQGDEKPQTANLAIILAGENLVTVRYVESRSFVLVAEEVTRADTRMGAVATLVLLIEALVDRTSERIEKAAAATDELVASALPSGVQPPRRWKADELGIVLAEIQSLHRDVARARESLVSLGRMTGYLVAQRDRHDTETWSRARSVSRDVAAVSDHASFVAQNIQFVLDTLLGLISVEQNAIVKFFSIVAVVLLPPTLIAAIYGMNFVHMPELGWRWGYPIALLVMLASAVGPYLWCRRRGWL